MRGRRNPQPTMFAFVNLDKRVSPGRPLRIIELVVADVLSRMSDDLNRMYSKIGRASVLPERLLKSLLLAGVEFHGCYSVKR